MFQCSQLRISSDDFQGYKEGPWWSTYLVLSFRVEGSTMTSTVGLNGVIRVASCELPPASHVN